jgi:hypothetical protein
MKNANFASFVTLILALAIIALAGFGIWQTNNPLFVLILLVLPEFPFGLIQHKMSLDAQAQDDEDDDEGDPAIGFTADLR